MKRIFLIAVAAIFFQLPLLTSIMLLPRIKVIASVRF
jgi:hypothetical protein